METDGRGDDDSACFGSVNEAADLVRWEEIEEMTERLRETKAEGYHKRCLQSEGHLQSPNKVD
jgi:ribosomal protein L29